MSDTQYIQRCLQLAALGGNAVSPNPQVGAVLVYEQRIIGEGYHKKFGEAHAEVNCINSVIQEHTPYIKDATMYVSLEPCHHTGKTPPCVDLILTHNIKTVVVGCKDQNILTNGKSIAKLKAHSVNVRISENEKECIEFIKPFLKWQKKRQAYVSLKWAQSKNKMISVANEQTKISCLESDILTHQLRAEHDGILIGYKTALTDNPSLTTRLVEGQNPIPIIIDWNLSLPNNLRLFNTKCIVLNLIESNTIGQIQRVKVEKSARAIIKALFQLNVFKVLVEGGAKTLSLFINENAWDTALSISSDQDIKKGIEAPQINQKPWSSKQIGTDHHFWFINNL